MFKMLVTHSFEWAVWSLEERPELRREPREWMGIPRMNRKEKRTKD